MSSLYSIDLLKELSDGFEEDGYTPEEVKALRSHGYLRATLRVLRGTHEIRPIDHIVDLAVPCKLPFTGAERVSPAKTGVVKLERRDDDLYLNGKKINLFISEKQKGDKAIGGHDFRKELEARGGNVSAKVLDHLVDYPQMWPESWKKDDQGNTIYVYFWDDIFRSPSRGGLYVRYGCWHGGRVVSNYDWLGSGWHSNDPSASVAS